jgi:hypothetical protein
MAATVVVQAGHGTTGSPTWTTVTSVRFKSADNDTADTNNPLVKPASGGTSYSFEKWFRLNCTVAPSNVINNLRFHRASGSLGTGITDYYGERNRTTEGFVTPVGTLSSYATTAVPTTATSLTKNNTDHTTTGEIGPYVVVQWRLDDTVQPGTQPTVTYRFTWDEA